MLRIGFLLSICFIWNCDKIREIGKDNIRNKLSAPQVSEKEIEKWKDKLGMQEAEVAKLDDQIRQMVRKTKEAGALSWRIARAYMKVGSYELGAAYYTKAIQERTDNIADVNEASSKPEIHKFESAIPYFEKALTLKDIDEDLLFETGLAYGNASRDRGWDKERRTIAVNIFRGLMRLHTDDMRYPYQLALIYFDSSLNDGLVDGVDAEGYNDTEKAMKLLQFVLKKHESLNEEGEIIPIRFTIANFLYRQGKVDAAEAEYNKIKSLLEKFKQEGKISEKLEKNPPYMNVTKNLKKIQEQKLKYAE
jgi:tetratricopeptide (TPR) repeat protein